MVSSLDRQIKACKNLYIFHSKKRCLEFFNICNIRKILTDDELDFCDPESYEIDIDTKESISYTFVLTI
jgi:hypothetical protein